MIVTSVRALNFGTERWAACLVIALLVVAPMLGMLSIGVRHETFVPSLSSAFAAIAVTEIGDKTFFIALVLSMQYSHLSVWGGAVSALCLMSIGASAAGSMASDYLSLWMTHAVVAVTFAAFGVHMLLDGCKANGSVSSEIEDELFGHHYRRLGVTVCPSLHVLFTTFALTFASEWGDRSQVATIAVAAEQDVYGACLGAVLGHSVCTGFAVMGGQYLARHISERLILFAGGCLFCIFSVSVAAEIVLQRL